MKRLQFLCLCLCLCLASATLAACAGGGTTTPTSEVATTVKGDVTPESICALLRDLCALPYAEMQLTVETAQGGFVLHDTYLTQVLANGDVKVSYDYDVLFPIVPGEPHASPVGHCSGSMTFREGREIIWEGDEYLYPLNLVSVPSFGFDTSVLLGAKFTHGKLVSATISDPSAFFGATVTWEDVKLTEISYTEEGIEGMEITGVDGETEFVLRYEFSF